MFGKVQYSMKILDLAQLNLGQNCPGSNAFKRARQPHDVHLYGHCEVIELHEL